MSDAPPAPETAAGRPFDVDSVFPQIGQIGDRTLAAAVRAVWHDLWQQSNWDDFEAMPTSPEIRYPARPHAQCVVAMALQIAQSFEDHHGVTVNRDHLIAAAILQDASKVVEYQPDGEGGATLSPTGRLYPHAFLAAQLAVAHGLPEEVVNAILMHTPQAAKFPATLEGKILYYVDQLDVIAIHGDRWRKELFVTK